MGKKNRIHCKKQLKTGSPLTLVLQLLGVLVLLFVHVHPVHPNNKKHFCLYYLNNLFAHRNGQIFSQVIFD